MKNKYLLDTNVVIDYLNALPYAKSYVEAYECSALSVISVIEILCAVPESKEKEVYHWLHNMFDIYSVDEKITLEAVRIRRTKKLKLPDTLILATAILHGFTLCTRDIKGFSGYPCVKLIKDLI